VQGERQPFEQRRPAERFGEIFTGEERRTRHA
jgi:hypothetical protein